jgi:hypothetical protein
MVTFNPDAAADDYRETIPKLPLSPFRSERKLTIFAALWEYCVFTAENLPA